jgi:Family of unknown function (DUF6412)
MGFHGVVLASLLLMSALVASPAGSLELAVVLVVALASLAVGTRVDVRRALVTSAGHGPTGEEGSLRGSFRRQQRPDEAGRPMPRAPGVAVGARF